MARHRGRGVGALLMLLLVTLVPTAHSAGGQPGATPAPLVRIPFPQDDGSLTPYTFEVGYPLMALVYDTLLWRDADGMPQPWLARSMDISADGRRLTLHLAEGVNWHDGTPLTASDVAFTFRFVADHPHPRFSPALEPVERLEVPDAATVVVWLRRPSPGFADQPLADLPILPAHVWRALPEGQLAPAGLPVGSGPYRLVDHRPGEGYRFEANPGYFRGPPTVTTIEVPIMRSVDETLTALRQRRVDMIPLSLPEGPTGRVRMPGNTLREGPSYLGTVLMFNLRQPPFDRRDVRAAVSEAIDLARLTRAAGNAVPADRGYLHPSSPWSSAEILHHADPASAATLATLDPIEVLAPDNDPVKLEAGRQVALALQRAGARASSRAVPRPELSRLVGEDGSPASFGAVIWTAPPLASYDPDFLRTVFGSDERIAPLNLSGYANPEFDEVAARAATTTEPAARRAVVGEQLRLLARDVPVVPLFFADGRYAFRPAVHNGWVFIKGSGILDKRSFVDAPPATPPAPRARPATTSGRRGLLGVLAIVVLGLAGLIATGTMIGSLRNRRSRG